MGSQDPTPRKSRPLIFVLLDTAAKTLQSSAREKSVLLALAGHLNAKRNGTEVWPSLSRLAALTGFSESSVRRSLHALHDGGLIKIRSDTGKSNTYTVNAEFIHRLAADPCQAGRGQDADPCHADTPTPVRLEVDPCQADTLTTKEQQMRTANPSSVGCSAILKVGDGPEQRQLAVHGLVMTAADAMRLAEEEQPTTEKRKRA